MTHDLFPKISITNDEIQTILNNHQFTVTSIELLQRNNRVVDFIINNNFILRFSQSPLAEELKLNRAKRLKHVPSIYISNEIIPCNSKLYYIL